MSGEEHGAQRIDRGVIAALALIVGIHVCLYFALHGSFGYDNDAPAYGRIAHEMRTGDFEVAQHPFTNRFAVTAPTAVAYLAGVNKYTTTVWPLVASLLTIVLVFVVLRRAFGKNTALLASFLLASNIVQVRYSSRLLPDIIVAMFMLAAASVLFAATRSDSRRVQAAGGVLCVAALFGGLLAKGTVVWGVPFFLGCMVLDLFRRRNRALWLWFILTGIVATGLFLLAYYLMTGNALFRLEGIQNTHNVAPWSFHDRETGEYVRRVTYEPLQFFLANPGFGLLFIWSLPALVHLVRPMRFLPEGTRYWAAYLAVVLSFFWFGTTSPTGYNPLPISERFLMPLLAPFSILSGITIVAMVEAKDRASVRPAVWLLSGAFLAAVAVLWQDGFKRSALYAGFLLLVPLLAFHLPRTNVARQLEAFAKSALVVFLFAAVTGFYTMNAQPPDRGLDLESDFLNEHLPQDEPLVLLADRHSSYMIPFFFESGLPDHVRVVDWTKAAALDDVGDARLLVFLHQPRLLAYYRHWGGEMPGFVETQPADWKLLVQEVTIATYGFLLFEIDEVEDLVDVLPPQRR